MFLRDLMYKQSVLFLCKKNEKYSNLCKNYLVKKFYKVKIIATNQSTKDLSLLNWKGDLILLFRSKIILKESTINKARIGCINFHPSTPKYRGVGGINYAIYNCDKYFGCTSHLIQNTKIDSGTILNVRRFKIPKKITLNKLLKKTHNHLYLQFKYVVPNLINKEKINKLIAQSKKEKWSNIYNNIKKLDDFYEIQIKENNFKNKIRATYLNDKYAPYYYSNNKKIKLTKNKIKDFISYE
jgi:phosphoribosylglycinamide formyltransferase-1